MRQQPFFIFLLNSSQRRLQRWIESHRQPDFQVSAAQAGVLFVLEKQDGALAGDIAQTLDLVPSAVSGLIDRMQRQQLLERKKCPQDGRATRLWLTPLGKDQLTLFKTQLAALNLRLTQGFTSDELAIVERWLNHIRQEFQD
ncbi:MarR family winged helix-turn-helix transcriptional regulator [Alkanindiges illinoisensis]|uniref:MarR family winged helix-turn-helix transcriptional regulator n=1 Tax=Alkanindiges illinoisensis TaxID=197183 RepID=UPI000478AE85|nr:MarR family winged helix-turn-helix transcriptional regulator [Alkanindiges illinoisensis]